MMPIKVTAALILNGSKALLCRRAPGEKLAGYWEFPGGKVEEGESDRECLRRELFEELGIVVEVGECVCSHSHQYAEFSITLVLYSALIADGFISLSVHDRYEWAPVSSLLNWNLAPADIPLAEAVVREFRLGDV